MYRYRRWKIAFLATTAGMATGIAGGQQPPPYSQPMDSTGVAAMAADGVPTKAQIQDAMRMMNGATVDRFLHDFPKTAAMGTPIKVRLRVPARMIRTLLVSEGGLLSDQYRDIPVSVHEDQGGGSYVLVPPLALGSVEFYISATFKDYKNSSADFTALVGAPDAPPDKFLAAGGFRNGVYKMRPGDTTSLLPSITFASAPKHPIELLDLLGHRNPYLKFRVQQAAGDPVISVDQDGHLAALRAGTAVVEAVFGNYVAPLTVQVRVPSPLDGALIFHAPDLAVKP